MIALRLNIRRDGTICLTDAAGSASTPDRQFPPVHAFTYDKIVALGPAARLDGARLTLELANARAVYRVLRDPVAARAALGLDEPPADDDGHPAPISFVAVELETWDLFSPPPIDEAGGARYRAAARDSVEAGAGDVASAGSVLVDEKPKGRR